MFGSPTGLATREPAGFCRLRALDTDVEAEEQKRPGENGCDHRQDRPHRRDRVEVVVNRRDHDTGNDPYDGQESYSVPGHTLGLPRLEDAALPFRSLGEVSFLWDAVYGGHAPRRHLIPEDLF